MEILLNQDQGALRDLARRMGGKRGATLSKNIAWTSRKLGERMYVVAALQVDFPVPNEEGWAIRARHLAAGLRKEVEWTDLMMIGRIKGSRTVTYDAISYMRVSPARVFAARSAPS